MTIAGEEATRGMWKARRRTNTMGCFVQEQRPTPESSTPLSEDPMSGRPIQSWRSDLIIEKDVLKTDFPQFDLVVANIPYNISSPLVYLSLLLQKEFSRRLLANPGDSDFNRLAVNVKLVADVKFVMDVSKREYANVQEWLAFTRTCSGRRTRRLVRCLGRRRRRRSWSLSAGRNGSKVGVMKQTCGSFDSEVEEDEHEDILLCLDTDASIFKEKIIGILISNGFEEKKTIELVTFAFFV